MQMVAPELTLIRKRIPALRLLPRFMFLSDLIVSQIWGVAPYPYARKNQLCNCSGGGPLYKRGSNIRS